MADELNKSDDDRAIRGLIERQAQAWNLCDADAFGATFTPDARYIAFFGGIYRGRSEIVGSHRLLWSKILRGTRMHYEILEIDFVASNVAVVMARGEVSAKVPKRLPKVQTYVAARQDGGSWLFTHFQNTKKNALMQFLTYRSGPAAVPSIDR